MQALNSLATPEEKLAALCKKYADLVSLLGTCYLFDYKFKCTVFVDVCQRRVDCNPDFTLEASALRLRR